PPDLLPVPVIKIAEINLGLKPIPIRGLLDSEGLDGFLTRDLKNICIDWEIYTDERQENRLRFTFAHELGHLVLHKEQIQQCDFRTLEDWVYFRQDFTKYDLTWFEQHAYEFAGRLLVPKHALETRISTLSAEIEKYRKMGGSEEERLIDAIARIICADFRVSADCIAKRIRIEKLQGHFHKRN
ncbi:MAG TPA: ImmA/IrrE family metallo-endopeptidase, partial [Acidobacteriota bacterium]|nr:ImmA/IrrE family metallo-endopeptidase [Acidobacteriota bacterium]